MGFRFRRSFKVAPGFRLGGVVPVVDRAEQRVAGLAVQDLDVLLEVLPDAERPTGSGQDHAPDADVVGDLTGRGLWTLTPRDGGTDIQFDWRVIADKPILRLLTPVLRPLFRWNHAWAIARAREGLEPYARASTAKD